MKSCHRPGCLSGWIYNEYADRARACECQRGVSGFRADYAPGGSIGARRRSMARRNGRKGGLRSAARRRQLSSGHRSAIRHRSRQTAMALAYRHRQLGAVEIRRRYEEAFPRPERPSAALSWEKGRETFVLYVRTLWRLYRACGQHCGTTKDQRATAMKNAGLPRCPRTIRRLNQKLEALGLGALLHARKGGATPGRKDHLVLEIRTPMKSRVTLPPEGGSSKPPPSSELAAAAPRRQKLSEPGPALSPPATPADDLGRPSAPEQPITRQHELEAAIRFTQMKVDAGFATGPARAQLHGLRAELRSLQATRLAASAPERQTG